MKLIFKKSFTKSYQKLVSTIQTKVDDTLSIFLQNPTHISLNNHSLKWIHADKRSINVTGDYRIIFRLVDNSTYEIVEIINVWTHSQLYR